MERQRLCATTNSDHKPNISTINYSISEIMLRKVGSPFITSTLRPASGYTTDKAIEQRRLQTSLQAHLWLVNISHNKSTHQFTIE
jgi:hypothetical protein